MDITTTPSGCYFVRSNALAIVNDVSEENEGTLVFI